MVIEKSSIPVLSINNCNKENTTDEEKQLSTRTSTSPHLQTNAIKIDEIQNSTCINPINTQLTILHMDTPPSTQSSDSSFAEPPLKKQRLEERDINNEYHSPSHESLHSPSHESLHSHSHFSGIHPSRLARIENSDKRQTITGIWKSKEDENDWILFESTAEHSNSSVIGYYKNMSLCKITGEWRKTHYYLQQEWFVDQPNNETDDQLTQIIKGTAILSDDGKSLTFQFNFDGDTNSSTTTAEMRVRHLTLHSRHISSSILKTLGIMNDSNDNAHDNDERRERNTYNRDNNARYQYSYQPSTNTDTDHRKYNYNNRQQQRYNYDDGYYHAHDQSYNYSGHNQYYHRPQTHSQQVYNSGHSYYDNRRSFHSRSDVRSNMQSSNSYYMKNRDFNENTPDVQILSVKYPSKNQNRRRNENKSGGNYKNNSSSMNVRKDKNYRQMKNNSPNIKHRKKERRTSAVYKTKTMAMVRVPSPDLLSSVTDDDFDANAWPICSPLSPMPSPSPPISVSSESQNKGSQSPMIINSAINAEIKSKSVSLKSDKKQSSDVEVVRKKVASKGHKSHHKHHHRRSKHKKRHKNGKKKKHTKHASDSAAHRLSKGQKENEKVFEAVAREFRKYKKEFLDSNIYKSTVTRCAKRMIDKYRSKKSEHESDDTKKYNVKQFLNTRREYIEKFVGRYVAETKKKKK